MKKFFLLLMLVSFNAKTFSQDTTSHPNSKEYYLQKSKDQKGIAWVLLVGGTAAIAGGVITMVNNDLSNMFSDEPPNNSGSIALIVIGGLADIASIHFFISAGKNKARAATVAFSDQPLSLPHNGSIALKYVPGVTFKINL